MTKKRPPSKKKPYRDLAKYSGLGFQMIVIILVGYFLGDWLDRKYTEGDKPIYTAISTLVFSGVAMYLIIKEVLNNND